MRIKVTQARLREAKEKLALMAGCQILSTAEGFKYMQRQLTPRNTIRESWCEPRRKEIVAVKAALRRFGKDMQAVKQVAAHVTVEDASQSVTQRAYRVFYRGILVDTLGNERQTPDFSLDNPYQMYEPNEQILAAARYILNQRRDVLPEGMHNPDLIPKNPRLATA